MLDNLTLEQIDFLLEYKLEEFTDDQIELLTENRVEFIKNANKDKISTEHDPESANMSSDKIVDHIASKIDPSSRKEHTQWLVNRYKAGDFKLSDGRGIKKNLSKFEDAKQHLEKKDLNSIKSISELNDHVAVVAKKVDLVKKDKEESEPKEMLKVFEENGAVGYKVPSRATSIHNYGPNGKLAKTTWCTAADSRRNMFNGYEGGKYTLHLPDGKVMQLHHQSNQLMDENDKPVDTRSPKYAEHASTIKNFIHTTHALEDHPPSDLVAKNPIGNTSAEISKQLDEYKSKLYKAKEEHQKYIPYHIASDLGERHNKIIEMVKNSKLDDETFEKLLQVPVLGRHNDEVKFDDWSTHNSASLDAKPEHLRKMAENTIKAYHSGDIHGGSAKLADIASNPNVEADVQHSIIGAAIKHDDTDLAQSIAMRGHNLQPEHIERLASNFKVSSNLVRNKTSRIPAEHFDKAVEDDPSAIGFNRFIDHNDVPDHVAKKFLETAPDYYHDNVIRNPSVSKETILSHYEHAINTPGFNTKIPLNSILERDDVHGTDVDRVVNLGLHPNLPKSSNDYWQSSSKLSRDHINKILKSDSLTDFGAITNSPKIKSEDLDTVINHPNFDSTKYLPTSKIALSPAVKPKNLDTLLDKDISKDTIRALLPNDTDPPEALSHGHLTKILSAPATTVNQKHQILHNPNVQLSHFNSLKDDIRMHGAISSSKHAPPSILHTLATSPMDHVRLNVAKNPNTEERTHRILAGDSVKEIADIASKKVKK